AREEVFYTITKHAAVIRMKTGVKKDGTLMARECEIHLDTGAYAEIGPRVAKKSGYTAAGPYKIPNLKIDSYSVYTNKPPAGAVSASRSRRGLWSRRWISSPQRSKWTRSSCADKTVTTKATSSSRKRPYVRLGSRSA